MTETSPPPGLRLETCRHGIFATIEGDSHVSRSLQVYGEWCELEIQLLTQILKPGDFVVDAGANLGAHAVPFARAVGPRGRVYAFEPQPRVHAALQANAFLNGMGHLIPILAGLGAEEGTARFPDGVDEGIQNFGGVQLGPYMAPEREIKRAIRVPVAPLDEILTLDRLRLIKADVEQMELALIQGATETIRRHQPIVFLENGKSSDTDALVEAMEALGYRGYWQAAFLFQADNFRGESQNVFGNQACANILFAPKAVKVTNMTPVTGAASHPFRSQRDAAQEREEMP
ncbi:MAG: FkbM family methyltransferase [Pseudomonadota bacterium]